MVRRANTPPGQLGSQTTYAFPTLVTNAIGHTVYAQYDYHLGKAVDGEDANQIKSSGFYGDPLDRPTEIRRDVIGGLAYSKTRFIYDDLNRTITTGNDQITVGDFAQQSLIKNDGLGRTNRQAAYEGDTGNANTWAIVDTQFDGLGRVRRGSNPFRDTDPLNAAAPSGIWTATMEVVIPSVSDFARGLLVHMSIPSELRLWAFFVLAESGAIDFQEVESHPQGEILISALWDASFEGKISEDALKAAEDLSGQQREGKPLAK